MLDTALFISGWEGAIMTHPHVLFSAGIILSVESEVGGSESELKGLARFFADVAVNNAVVCLLAELGDLTDVGILAFNGLGEEFAQLVPVGFDLSHGLGIARFVNFISVVDIVVFSHYGGESSLAVDMLGKLQIAQGGHGFELDFGRVINFAVNHLTEIFGTESNRDVGGLGAFQTGILDPFGVEVECERRIVVDQFLCDSLVVFAVEDVGKHGQKGILHLLFMAFHCGEVEVAGGDKAVVGEGIVFEFKRFDFAHAFEFDGAVFVGLLHDRFHGGRARCERQGCDAQRKHVAED